MNLVSVCGGMMAVDGGDSEKAMNHRRASHLHWALWFIAGHTQYGILTRQCQAACDLNPIENRWDLIRRDRNRVQLASTVNDLRTVVDVARQRLPQATINGIFTGLRPVPEFNRGRIVAYRDCGLPFREIGSRVGRNQTTVIRICDRRMQEGMTYKFGRSHPPQGATSLSARTIRRRLQQSGLSARCPLLGLPLTPNHGHLRCQWCDERRMWATEWNEVVFTDDSRICLQHHDGRIRVWRHHGERILNSCVMHHHTDPAQGIMPALHLRGVGASCTYLQGLATTIFQQDNARPHVARIVQRSFVNHQIELFRWPARSPDLSPIENTWSMVAQRLTQITPPAATPDQLWQRVEAAWSAVPQEHTQSLFESMPRRVAAVICNNGGYSCC
ncbi:transposable element Tc1 transposase [Trichonephila clavipes]|uniref:Transposable element Tc1 transposase n=1 Tax=Trichonephila clavipes TaxID=2585209 RepID=A0A8X6WJZ3_TRICX|nr:transposable element Tc1 transposase [Trichonephila clavipes]